MARKNSPGLQAWVGLPNASALPVRRSLRECRDEGGKVAAEAVLVERCLACEAEAVGTLEGSRFYPDPVCTHILETPRLPGARVRAGGSRERLLTPYDPPRFTSFPTNATR
jgi:hypothetical protein